METDMLQMVMHVVQWLRYSPMNLGNINHQEQEDCGGKEKRTVHVPVHISNASGFV